MPLFTTYDPGRVIVTFRGILLLGYMDGTFVTAERTEDAYSMPVGAGGDVTRVRSRNRTGTVTATLLQASPANDLLSTIAALDEEQGTGTGALLVKDIGGTTLCHAAVAWIKKMPSTEYGTDASGRAWAFDCAELKMWVGGALV